MHAGYAIGKQDCERLHDPIFSNFQNQQTSFLHQREKRQFACQLKEWLVSSLLFRWLGYTLNARGVLHYLYSLNAVGVSDKSSHPFAGVT
jgi:hypothetical protein